MEIFVQFYNYNFHAINGLIALKKLKYCRKITTVNATCDYMKNKEFHILSEKLVQNTQSKWLREGYVKE